MGVSASIGGDARTDMGWIQSSTIAQAAMIAVAVRQASTAESMNNKQISILNRQMKLAEEAREYWKTTYVPCERATVQEICAEPKYELQYDRTSGRYVAAVRKSFGAINDRIRCTGRYCTGLTAAMIKDIAVQEAIAISDATNFAYRVEEDRKEAKDAVRWSRRMEALAMGRDLNKTAITANAAASDIAGNLSKQASAGADGAWQGVGYLLGRNGGVQSNTFSAKQDQYPPAPAQPYSTHIPVPIPKPEYSANPNRPVINVASNPVLDAMKLSWNHWQKDGSTGFQDLNNAANTAGNSGSSGNK